MDSPPLVSFDAAQKPTGLAIDLGMEIAKRLGDKQVSWRVTPFSGLVPALLASQCDLIVDQLFDKPERREVIDIVNYMYSSQSVVVPKGNPRTSRRSMTCPATRSPCSTALPSRPCSTPRTTSWPRPARRR
jgi:polar amino acid transport system substrate-binding protein